jgi:hypothetical protein
MEATPTMLIEAGATLMAGPPVVYEASKPGQQVLRTGVDLGGTRR